MSSLLFVAILVCPCPMSPARSFKNTRTGASSYSFFACVLFIISHAQEVLNMWLLIVTLVALSMRWGWRRDFLSCSKSLQEDSQIASLGLKTFGKTFHWPGNHLFLSRMQMRTLSFVYFVVCIMLIHSWNLVNGWLKWLFLNTVCWWRALAYQKRKLLDPNPRPVQSASGF